MSASMAPLRVAHVIQSLEPGQGGTTAAALNLITAALRACDELRVVVLAPTPGATPRIDEAVQSRIEWRWTGAGGLFRAGDLARAATQAARDSSADVVHFHGLWSPDLVAIARALRDAGLPLVWQPHGMLMAPAFAQKRWKKELFYRLGLRDALHSADRVLFSSSGEARLSLRRAPALARIAKVIALPVDAGRHNAQTTDGPACASRRDGPLVFLGRLHPVKRVDLTLRAFAEALKQQPSLSLIVAGAGQQRYERRLRRLASKLNIVNSVQFTGWLQAAEKQALLARAGAMALNSRFENFGLSAAEGAIVGAPLVLTDNLPVAVDLQAVEGAFVAPAEPAALARAMLQALTTEEAAERAARAQRWALKTFDAMRIGADLNRLYDEVAGAKRDQPSP